MEVKEVHVSDFEAEVLNSDKICMVDFWADWCGPCKMLSPIVEKIAEEREDIKVCKVNIDEEMDLALKYNVMSIPTVIAFESGEIKKRTVGLCSKSDLLSILD